LFQKITEKLEPSEEFVWHISDSNKLEVMLQLVSAVRTELKKVGIGQSLATTCVFKKE